MSRQVRDSRDMDTVFEQVVKSLYGDSVDPREVWDLTKSMPDQSSVHIPKAPGTRTQKRKAIAGGLLLSTGAESLAVSDAGKNAFKAFKKPVVPNIPSSIHPVQDATKAAKTAKELAGPDGKKKAALKFGLQAANLGVGLAAAHELLKKPEYPNQSAAAPKQNAQKTETKIKKAFFKAKTVVTSADKLEHIRANIKTAKRGQKYVVAAAGAGGAAGGYVGMKRYGLKIANPIQPDNRKSAIAVKKNQIVDFTWEGEISKVDEDKHLVFGWCSLSKVNGEPIVDLQGDYIPIEETETSAYRYVIESRKGGDMHRRVSKFNEDQPFHTGDLVESMVFTPEKLEKMGLPPDALPHGWWIGMKINDEEQWQNVKDGKRLGFSIHGKGRRVEKAL